LGDLQQTKQNTFLLEPNLAKNTKRKPKKKKKQNFKTLNPQPIKSFSTPRYTEKTGGFQHHQMPAPTCLGDADKQDWMLKE
jgi:hypothetical protein